MELRVLQYFLAVCREQSISGAAEALHLSQPTLSRQLKEMETELGTQLFIRGNRRIILTEEGMILRKRAEEITELVHKAEHEISLTNDYIAGDITIGAGETDGVRFLARAVRLLQCHYPDIHLHIISGDGETVSESLERGLIDFGFFSGEIDTSRYESLRIPQTDSFGVLMRRDSPLAQKEILSPQDLFKEPLIVSRQMLQKGDAGNVLNCSQDMLHIVGTYSLLYNGSIMVEEGLGYALCFDKIIHVSDDSTLCFRPVHTAIKAPLYLVWKKYTHFTKAAEKFLFQIQELTR